MTQPGGNNGADLLLLSLISCAAWDVIRILQKQRQSISGFGVTAACVCEAEAPWRFSHITITYRLTGNDLNENRICRAIELAEKKYCSIYATLQPVVELTSELVIEVES